METTNNSSEYINSADALSRIGGNMSLYVRLLGRFLEGNHYDLLEASILSGDMVEATHQAHTLKGVSANLSLVKINTLTADLEQLLKDNADYSARLAELKEAFEATTQEITQIMEQGA